MLTSNLDYFLMNRSVLKSSKKSPLFNATQMKTIWGKIGASITLPCSINIDKNESFSLDWRKDGHLVLSAFGGEQGHVTPALQGRLARDESIGITIHSVTNDDAGTYQCSLTKFSKQPTKSEKGITIKLVVHVAPKISQPTSNQRIFKKINSDLIFECKAYGVPSPEITWSRNDQIVSVSSVLKIPKLYEKDSGIYTCLAVNIEGNATSNIEIMFSKAASFDLVPTNKTVVEGSNVYWHCHANSQPGNLVYSWKFENKPIKTTSVGLRANIRSSDLSLQDVRKSDIGLYTCEAKNNNDDAISTNAYLNVFYPPEVSSNHQPVKTVSSGKNVTISCDVTANPSPTIYTWSKNGHFLFSKENNKIDILNSKPGDNGIYACQAENLAGKGSFIETHLIVAEPPIFSMIPPMEIRVRQGEEIDIPCQGFGDPMPITYWIKNKKRINQPKLSFKNITHSDHGVYECVVSNAVDTISTKLKLYVESTKPQPATSVKFLCIGSSTLKISWTAGYNGGYDQFFIVYALNEMNSQWTKIRTSLNETVMENLEPFISYKINIESVNKKGSSNSTIFNRQSCTSLYPPDNIYLCGFNEICWTAAEGASSYKIESKPEKSPTFYEVAEVFETYYRIDKNVDLHKPIHYRVRSLRPAYPPSEPTTELRLGSSENTELPIVMLLGVFSIFLSCICFLSLWRFFNRVNKKKEKKKIRKLSSHQEYRRFTLGSSSSSSQPGTETYCEPTIRLLNKNNAWREEDHISVRQPSSNYQSSIIEYDHEYCDETPIDDMFRDRYILSVQDPPAQLYQDLKLERLRREYRQSQI